MTVNEWRTRVNVEWDRVTQNAERELLNTLYTRNHETEWCIVPLEQVGVYHIDEDAIRMNRPRSYGWNYTLSAETTDINQELFAKLLGYHFADAPDTAEKEREIDTSAIEEFLDGIEVRQNR